VRTKFRKMSQEGIKPVIDLQNANIAQVGEKPSTDLLCNKGVNVKLDILWHFQVTDSYRAQKAVSVKQYKLKFCQVFHVYTLKKFPILYT
jgi:hypothetical protein